MDQLPVPTTKTVLVLLFAVVLLSGGVALVAAQLSLPASAGAQVRAAAETRELKKLNRSLAKVNRTLTDIEAAVSSEADETGPSLRRNARDTADNVQKLCRVIAEFPSEC